MKTSPWVVILILLCTTAFILTEGCENAGIPKKARDAAAVQRIADTLERWTDRKTPVGAVVLIIRNGEMVMHEAFGWSSLERQIPMDTSTMFRMASMTKPILATGVLKLLEEGKLRLSDKVSSYIPAYKGIFGDSISVEHLLRHTSGYGRHQVWEGNSEMAKYPNIQAAVAVIARQAPKSNLGTEDYSSLNSALLTEIIRVAANMPAEEYIRINVLAPLKMTNTYLLDDTTAAWYQKLASTYEYNKDSSSVSLYWDPQKDTTLAPYFRGGVGVLSTSTDYAKFLNMWLHKGTLAGVRILKEETVLKALDNMGKYFGLHWAVPQAPATDDMPGIFGHRGWYGTSAVVYPKDKAIVLYLTQTYNQPMIWEFHELLAYSGLFSHEGPYELDMIHPEFPPQPDDSILEKHTGTYTATTPDSIVWTLEIMLQDNHLATHVSSKVETWKERLVFMGDNRFSPGFIDGNSPIAVHEGVYYHFKQNRYVDFVARGNLEFSFKIK